MRYCFLYLYPVSLPHQVLPFFLFPEQTDALALTIWAVVTVTERNNLKRFNDFDDAIFKNIAG